MSARLNSINRIVAAVLACVWTAVGLAGFVAAYLSGRWLLALAGFFALWYALLFARVAVEGRLLECNHCPVMACPLAARSK